MQRPPSIVLFERLYLGSLLLWAINTAAFWSTTRQVMADNPTYAANPQIQAIMVPLMIGSVAVVALVSLLLWYLVARQASVAGKWLVVVTEALGVLAAVMTLYRLVSATTGSPVMAAIGLVVTALAVASAVMLFRPDARAWLGEENPRDVEPLA